jgi:hypothetical protein
MSVPLVVATCLLHYSKYIALIMLIQGRFRLDLRTVFFKHSSVIARVGVECNHLPKHAFSLKKATKSCTNDSNTY